MERCERYGYVNDVFEAKAFNQNIGNWNVASVEDMYRMFYKAEDFNQAISNWNVASVENMNRMFHTAQGIQSRHLGVGRCERYGYGNDVL